MKNISLRNFLFAVLVPVLSLQALDVKEDTNNKVVVFGLGVGGHQRPGTGGGSNGHQL